jgi:plasmid maintenance system antidote protein VapI
MSPIGLAFIACVGFGLALAARQALGKECGLRAAAERARDAAVKTLSANRDWEMDEVLRFRRLLDCHVDVIIAEMTEFRERSVPSPGGVLQSLCSWNVDWKRDLAARAGMNPADVEKLLKNDLPVTPKLARKLEIFTGAPARYWEYLWRVYAEYRSDTDKTLALRINEVSKAQRRPVLQVIDDATSESAPAPLPSGTTAAQRRAVSPQDHAARFAHAEISGPSVSAAQTKRSKAAELPPVSPPPERPARSTPQAPAATPSSAPHNAVQALPPPAVPLPELAATQGRRRPITTSSNTHRRSADADPNQGTAQRRASTLTDFPLQHQHPPQVEGSDWAEAERSPLNETLPGVGEKSTP